MTIDKSLKQYYDVPGTKKIKGQLHKLAYITPKEAKALKKMGGIETRTPEGILAYPGHHGSSGSSAGVSQGGGGGGGGRQDREGAASSRTYSAPAPSPDRQDRARQQAAAEQAAAEQANEEPTSKSDVGGRNMLAVYDPNNTTGWKEKGLHEDSRGNETNPVDRGEMDSRSYAKQQEQFRKPTYEKYTTHSPFTDEPIISERIKKYSPTYYQDKYSPPKDTGGIMSKVLGFLGDTALTVASGGSNKALAYTAKAIQAKRKYDKFKESALAKKLGLDQKINNLTSTIDKAKGRKFDSDDLLGTADWQGEQKRNKTFHEGKGDGDRQQVTTVQEAVAGKGLEEGQKMLGTDEIKKRHRLLETTLNDGFYVDNEGRTIQLNDQQKAMLTNYISQIDKYLVNVDTRTMSAYGGRIDKPLTGRSRDI